ncbi:hypothetical protein ACFY05_42105 [Microtetraspora fusca]|uniref:Uncharacterized protein n=1 Tax=Microtetraspora fusca TaxID=1997 RepID=A0ABW6VK09_MICFU
MTEQPRTAAELPVSLARELAYSNLGDTIDGWTVVENEQTDARRWVSVHSLVIRNEAGEHYAGWYSRGLTEYQDTRPWEDETVARFDPVVPRTRLVEVTEYVPADKVEPARGGDQ